MKKFIYAFLFFTVIFMRSSMGDQAITFSMPNGRLGNKLQAALNAYYLAWKYNVPFLFQPFPGSEQFVIHHQTAWLSQIQKPFSHSSSFNSLSELEHILATTPSMLIYARLGIPCYDDELFLAPQEFKDQAKKLFQLTYSIPLITPAPNTFSVALHVRRGGGHDHPLLGIQIYKEHVKGLPIQKQYYSDIEWPLRFVPLQYYVDQLERIYQMHNDKNISVFIFTDDRNPLNLKKIFEDMFTGKNITFHAKASSSPTHETLKDLYSMATFDCLIRPYSTFSIISQMVGNHQLIFYPKEVVWEKNKILRVTKVAMITNQTQWTVLDN